MYLSRTKYDNSTFLESNYNDIEWIEYYSNEIEKNETKSKLYSSKVPGNCFSKIKILTLSQNLSSQKFEVRNFRKCSNFFF